MHLSHMYLGSDKLSLRLISIIMGYNRIFYNESLKFTNLTERKDSTAAYLLKTHAI